MIEFPNINPVAFEIGPLAVRWYGLAFVSGIALGWLLLHLRARRGLHGFDANQVGDMMFYGALGMVLGGRIGYVLFYNFADYLAHPVAILQVWKGGMSFHGGMLGFALAMAWYARHIGRPFLALTDFIVPIGPIGLFLGRIANFINSELWGLPTNMPWGVVFPDARGLGLARHPSQLYEAALEGVVLFLILWPLSRRPRRLGLLSALFLLLYGCFRFAIEFFREPDAHIGYLAGGWLTEGQVLSTPMIIAGIAILLFVTRNAAPPTRTLAP